jgi:hypothetical protein
MRTTRQITLIILLALLVAPGLLAAAPAQGHHAAKAGASAPAPAGSLSSVFNTVWNLLVSYAKSGAAIPLGGDTTTNGSNPSGNGDNGGMLDPSGAPKVG